MKSNSLENLRSEIDELDQKIQLLISERADLAAQVALVKQDSKTQSAFYRPEREAEVLSKVIKRNKSLLKDKDIALIFRGCSSARQADIISLKMRAISLSLSKLLFL